MHREASSALRHHDEAGRQANQMHQVHKEYHAAQCRGCLPAPNPTSPAWISRYFERELRLHKNERLLHADLERWCSNYGNPKSCRPISGRVHLGREWVILSDVWKHVLRPMLRPVLRPVTIYENRTLFALKQFRAIIFLSHSRHPQ